MSSYSAEKVAHLKSGRKLVEMYLYAEHCKGKVESDLVFVF